MKSEEITRSVSPVAPPAQGQSAIGTFLRRLTWRREIGPLSGEARVEVRELVSDQTPTPEPEADTSPS